jgi:quinoprotein glucose dehydrogenase
MQRLGAANLGWFAPPEEGKPTPLYGLHGGAEWTGGSFDPTTGFLYVNVNKQPWMITMYRDDEGSRNPNQPATAGENIYRQSCAACHGHRGEGGGIAPPLLGLRRRLTEHDVLQTIQNGRGIMPRVATLTEPQKKDLLDFLFHRDRPTESEPQASFSGHLIRLLDHQGYPACKPPWGILVCLNLNTGRIVWKAVLGEYEELTAQGIPKTGTPNLGGTLVTAGGLVFCAGTRDNKIRAFDKDSGQELWSHDLPWGGYAPPSTYEVGGTQFVVIAATGGGFPGRGVPAGPNETGDAYVAFAISKNKTILPKHTADSRSLNVSEVVSRQ